MTGSYLIIGAGVFGVSTAIHLKNRQPSAVVTLIDASFPSKRSASWDWGKVVRADYADITYMKLALEAQEIWRNDPLYRSVYHQCGQVGIVDKEYAALLIKNYAKLGVKGKTACLINAGDVRKLYGGILKDAELDDAEAIFQNEGCGWVEASKALESAIETAASAGVDCVESQVVRLEFDEQTCVGARDDNGRVFTADRIIVATGAATAKLLADSAPDWPELQIGDRLTAAAVWYGIAKLDAVTAEELHGGPLFTRYSGENEGSGFPVNKDNTIKFSRDVSFTNTVRHPSGQLISMPTSGPDYDQWTVTEKMKTELVEVAKSMYGRDFEWQNYRICWDAITPTQDFLVCSHPHCGSLFLATGGSFHAWKFLPIIGQYVVEMMEGDLNPDLAARWAWDRELEGDGVHDGLIPQRQLRDLL